MKSSMAESSTTRALLLFSFLTLVLFSQTSNAAIQTVPYVDVSKYLGDWYQIARNPLSFEGNCACSRQQLGVATNGTGRVTVYNSCNDTTPQGAIREIRGFATNDDPASNAKFTVDFGLPKLGKYWIIGLGANYEYAIVSDPGETSLYILSKTPTLDPALYQEAVTKAAAQTRTDKLVMMEHAGCVYP